MAWDDLDDEPEGSFWQKWFGGVVVPAVAAALGIMCIVRQRGSISGDWYGFGPQLDLRGLNAVALGIAVLCVGAFLHFHYFWTSVDRLEPYAMRGKILAVLLFILAAGLIYLRVIAYG